MRDYNKYILDFVENKNPNHFKKILKNFNCMGDFHLEKSKKFYSYYENFLISIGKNFDYGLKCYLKMIDDMNSETFNFFKTKKYSSSNFKEVNERVYNNPKIMNYYIHGLIISQFIWEQHFMSYKFFLEYINSINNVPNNYLEIGVGHGLLLSESIACFKNRTNFDAIDISKTSIDFSRNFINNSKINYILEDVFKFNPKCKYDFISMGEVLEHVEKPESLLVKVKSIMNDDGVLFITTPTNAPTIDHIYLFRNINQIKKLIIRSGFTIMKEKITPAENLSKQKIKKYLVSEHYSAFLKKTPNEH